MRVVLVQDAIPFLGGAERVLEAVLEIFPEAPIYTLLFNPKELKGTAIPKQKIHTSFIDRLPGSHTRHRLYLPFYPIAIEQFDLRDFDVILSFSYAVAHGVVPRPDQLHISMIYTPLRQAWHFYHQYLNENGLSSGLRSWGMKILLHYLRLWDWAAAERVDKFVAISKWVKQCIWRAYRRSAEVIYPPVDLEKFQLSKFRDDFYLVLSRLSPHKKVEIIVRAFSKLGLPLVVIGDGKDYKRLRKEAASNVTLLGRQPDRVVRETLGKAKALVHAAEEDFGISLVEAQAAGCPVIAYRGGGALETVLPNKTGLFFDEQTPESLIEAIKAYETTNPSFDILDLRKNARRFSKEKFKREYHQLITSAWEAFQAKGNRYGL